MTTQQRTGAAVLYSKKPKDEPQQMDPLQQGTVPTSAKNQTGADDTPDDFKNKNMAALLNPTNKMKGQPRPQTPSPAPPPPGTPSNYTSVVALTGVAIAGGGGREAGPSGFAWLAALRIVLELLVPEKQLLSGGEHKLAVAIGTDQDSVDELDIHVASPPCGKG
jgi:hypothetical protein